MSAKPSAPAALYKRTLLSLFALCLGGIMALNAYAHCQGTAPLSDKQVRYVYQTMIRLLHATPAQQEKAWQRTKRTFRTENDLLEYARQYTSESLSSYLQAEHEYRAWYNSCSRSGRSHDGGSSDSSGCTSNVQCAGHAQCVGGECADIGGPRSDCRNNGGCAGGFNCGTDGLCT